MKALAIVPARGGSKRLPRKNLRELGGRPLVCRTLDAAERSGVFDQVILSSDDAEILDLAKGYRTVVGARRPDSLSGDHAKALDVVLSIVDQPELRDSFDVVALLLPTAPLRNERHIREGMALLDETLDGVISVTSYEFPPQLGVVLREGIIEPVLSPSPLLTGNTRSQDQEVIYRPNGGFYIQWMRKFLVNRNFWKGQVRAYPMTRLDSIDIDDQADFEYAQFILDRSARPDAAGAGS